MKVLIVGSVALDTIKTPKANCRDVLGGSATYSSVSASYFSKTALVAVVGGDFPPKYIDLLKAKGVDISGLEIVKDGSTFRWQGEYGWDFADPKTLATHLNVFAQFNPKIPKEYKKIPYLFLANIDPDLQIAVLSQMRKPKLVLADTMNYWITSKRESLIKLLKYVDIFLLNESEARQLSGETSTVKAAKAILKFGPGRLIIKKGEHGALLFSKNSVFCAPAFLLEDIYDPTGAGDTFAGGFVGYIASLNKINEENLRKAVIYGNIMATFTVEDFSLNRLSKITKADIRKRIKRYQDLTCF